MMLITAPVLLVLCLAASTLSAATPLRVGTIHYGEPAREIKKFWPFTEYLAKQLQGEGIGRGSVVIANSIPQMASFMREGKIDLLVDSSYPSATISKLAGSKFLLRRWKKGMGDYRSIIFVRKDAGLTQLKELKGKVVAFEEPFSTSGYYLPRLFLARAGLKLARQENAGDPVAAGRVGYRFSYSASNTMLWVLRGVVSAGAMDDQTYQAEARGSLDSLKIIFQTPSLPRQIISYRAGLTPRVVNKIKQVLLHMHESEEGRKILASFDDARFDELSPPALAFLRGIMQATSSAGEDLE